ncbi:hypothetical protein CAPTEDRAFT_190843 [Capitella teleta]|uniref:Neurotransmitter-gated ion-channel ligand-binding domain-containing protein n=1 Tax=Capitella teleta TaxID=283909 RepID=R7TXH3_CAPTE|nr:hypothetical protein CAPTEDRAFT_190843 [Capitella teleta]|eukprot:ELT98628.1 hypothetical protein CAPTEDRAFT_190843 [Capitella teleta]
MPHGNITTGHWSTYVASRPTGKFHLITYLTPSPTSIFAVDTQIEGSLNATSIIFSSVNVPLCRTQRRTSSRHDNGSKQSDAIAEDLLGDNRSHYLVILISKQRELIEMMTKLTSNVQENTRTLKTMQNIRPETAPMAETLPKMTSTYTKQRERIKVEIKVVILKVLQVDVAQQNAVADVYIEAKWQEPALRMVAQDALPTVNLDSYWSPQIRIANFDGPPSEDFSWREATGPELGYTNPLVYYKRRLRATFSQRFALRNFPFDCHEVTVEISSHRPAREVFLVEDRYDICEIAENAINDTQEWNLLNHVTVAQTTQGFSSNLQYPVLRVSFHLSRKFGAFVWKYILLVFLLVALSFSEYCISMAEPFYRLPIVMFCLLSCIVLNQTGRQNWPTMLFVSYLDVYFIGGFLVIVANASETAFIQIDSLDIDKEFVEIICIAVFACLFVLLHIVLIIVIYCRILSDRERMGDLESNYKSKQHVASRFIRNNNGKRSTQVGATSYTYHDQKSESLKSTKTSSMSMTGTLPPPTTEGVFEVAVHKKLEQVLIPPPIEQIRRTKKSTIPRRKSLKTENLHTVEEDD